MWVTVSAQTLAVPTIIAAAEDTVAQVRGTGETRQAAAPGSQQRQPTTSSATTAKDDQPPGPAMPDSRSASGAAYTRAGQSASARLVNASKPARKPNRGTTVGAGHQPAETGSQRQRPKPCRAPAVILDVIDDRMANGAAGELHIGPASAAVPVYERAAAALGTDMPAQPSGLGSAAAGATADGGPLEGSAACADARAANRPADGHAQAGPGVGNGMLVSPLAEPALSLTNAAGSRAIERPAEEQHQTAARSADLVAGNDLGEGGRPAPAVHATVLLPEVAALSLEATHAVAAAEHEAAEVQPVVQHAAVVRTEVQGPPIGADTITQPHESTADRAADVALPAESPPEPAAHVNYAQSIAVNGVQTSSMTVNPQSAAAAGHSTSGSQRRAKKRRRKATALGSSAPLPGAATFASAHVPSCTLLLLTTYYITAHQTDLARSATAGVLDSLQPQSAPASAAARPQPSPAVSMHGADNPDQQGGAQQKPLPQKAQPQSTADIFSMLLNDS